MNQLIAPCGINCGICLAFLREKNKCLGCRVDNEKIPISRSKCIIRNCEVFKNSGKKYCFECENFPCKRMKQLDKRYREKYNLSLINNLKLIKKDGIKKFLEEEKIKWKCKKCERTICVHRGYCLKCEK